MRDLIPGERRESAVQLDRCIANGLRAMRSSTIVLLAKLGKVHVEEYQPDYAPDTVRLFLDLTLGSESWRNPYWLNDPVGDSDQARQMIDSQNRELRNFITNLESIDGLSFFLCWHIEGEEFSGSHSRGLDPKDAMRNIASRIGAELGFLTI